MKMSSTPSSYVTLVSSDGFEFIVRRESAYVAETIKRMLDPNSEYIFYHIVGRNMPLHKGVSAEGARLWASRMGW